VRNKIYLSWLPNKWASKVGLLLILVLGLFLSVVRNKIFLIWFGLELKMFGVVPFITKRVNELKKVILLSKKEINVSFYYFLVQVLGSIFFLWGRIVSDLYIVRTFGLLIKLGLPPFFWWVPSIVSRLDWLSIGLLRTIQKIPGVLLMRLVFDMNIESCILIRLIGLIVSSIGIKTSYKKIKKLIGWSSVRNMRILIVLMVIKRKLGLTYYIFYSLLIISFCCLIRIFPTRNRINLYNFILLVFSGLPPMLGFLIKVYFIRRFYLIDTCLEHFMIVLPLAPYYLRGWKIVFFYLLLIVLQSIGYIKCFIKNKSSNRGKIIIKRGNIYKFLLELRIYLGCLIMIWH